MALKVVPPNDERCDVHTQRQPVRYVCESCLDKFGIDPAQSTPGRRSLGSRLRRARRRLRRAIARGDRRVLIGGGIAVVAAALVVIALASGGGGGGDEQEAGANGAPTEADVVSALGLVPGPGGAGWITTDGACWVVSIQFGADVRPGTIAGKGLVEATNEDATVGAAVSQNDFSVSEDECVARVGAALKTNF
jgi:hypothetical protein